MWRGKTLPAIAASKPDLIIISAGFDAHAKDDIQGPVNLGVKEADYEWLTEELCKIANTHSQGRVISCLGRWLPHPGRSRVRISAGVSPHTFASCSARTTNSGTLRLPRRSKSLTCDRGGSRRGQARRCT